MLDPLSLNKQKSRIRTRPSSLDLLECHHAFLHVMIVEKDNEKSSIGEGDESTSRDTYEVRVQEIGSDDEHVTMNRA